MIIWLSAILFFTLFLMIVYCNDNTGKAIIDSQEHISYVEHVELMMSDVDAEEDFENNLRRCGYTEEWFEREYGNDKYIAPIHDRIKKDKYFVAKNL